MLEISGTHRYVSQVFFSIQPFYVRFKSFQEYVACLFYNEEAVQVNSELRTGRISDSFLQIKIVLLSF